VLRVRWSWCSKIWSRLSREAPRTLLCRTRCNACEVPHSLQCIEVMYHALLSCLVASLVLCSFCLQSCRSNFRVIHEEPALKKSRKTGDGVQATIRASVLLSSVLSDASNSRLPTVASATLPATATSTVQMASPTHHLAVRTDVVSKREQTSSMESEETDTKPALKQLNFLR
jgi:hypothetical protein